MRGREVMMAVLATREELGFAVGDERDHHRIDGSYHNKKPNFQNAPDPRFRGSGGFWTFWFLAEKPAGTKKWKNQISNT